jgi:hypothetical protein
VRQIPGGRPHFEKTVYEGLARENLSNPAGAFEDNKLIEKIEPLLIF